MIWTLALLAASATPATELPVFSFRGIDTETAISDLPANVRCEQISPEQKRCEDSDHSIGNVHANEVIYYFVKNKLSLLVFYTPRDHFGLLIRTFSAKYGPPNHEGSNDPELATYLWHFKGGDLTAKKISSPTDNVPWREVIWVKFHSIINDPPPPRPANDVKVDF